MLLYWSLSHVELDGGTRDALPTRGLSYPDKASEYGWVNHLTALALHQRNKATPQNGTKRREVVHDRRDNNVVVGGIVTELVRRVFLGLEIDCQLHALQAHPT
jgi:hypothetical protein